MNLAGKNLVFFLALATLFSGCAPPGRRALLKGQRMMEEGDYAGAIANLKTAASLLATNARVWNYLGLAYHHAGQFTNAESAYRNALSRDRRLAEAHYNLGCARLEQNRPDFGKAEFTAFTALRPNVPEGWVKAGVAALRSRELPAAENAFKEALRLDAQNAEALNGLGVVQAQRNHPRDAANCFNAALKQRPDYAPALLNLAIVSQVSLNDRALALQKYRAYLALSPRAPDWDAVNALARELDQLINPAPRAVAPPPGVPAPSRTNPVAARPSNTANAAPQAVGPVRPEPVQPAQKISPAPAPPVNVEIVRVPPQPEKRGVAPQSNPSALVPRDTSTAASAAPPILDSTLKIPAETGSEFPRYRYHPIAKPSEGDHSAAERIFAEGVEAQRANRLREAIRSYRQATQVDPAYYDAQYRLGVAAAAAGDLPQALMAYETALTIRPGSPDARTYFAQALKQANYPVDAALQLETVLMDHPNDTGAHLTLGNLYAQQLHQPARAREHYLKVLETDPQNPQAPSIRYWLAANPH